METIAFVRAAHFAAILIPPGILAFQSLIARPAGKNSNETKKTVLVAKEKLVLRLALVSAALALVTGLAWFGIVSSDMSDGPLDRQVIITVLTKTHFGAVWSFHLALILLLCGTLGHILCRKIYRYSFLTSWLIAVAALVSVASAGHACATTYPVISVTVDALHLLTASFWPAGLLPMALYLATLRRRSELNEVVSKMTERFSWMSLLSVPILALTGLLNTWLITGKFLSIQTPYERILMTKILVFGAIVGIGAINWWKIKPRLCDLSHKGNSPVIALFWNVTIETGFACIILLLTGVLGETSPV